MFKAYNNKGSVVAGDAGKTLDEAIRLANQWNADPHVNPDLIVSRVSNGQESETVQIPLPF